MYSNYITHIREPSLGILFFICLMTINDWYAGNNLVLKIIGFVIVVAIGYYGLHQNDKVRKKVLKFQLFDSLFFGYACLILATGLPVLFGATTMTKLSTPYSISSLLYLAFLAPILEEVIFRQVLYRDWAYYLNKIIGQIIIGFVFIILHNPTNYYSWIFYVISTIGLYTAYTLSGDNLKVSILIHMTNNVIIAAFAMNQIILVHV